MSFLGNFIDSRIARNFFLGNFSFSMFSLNTFIVRYFFWIATHALIYFWNPEST